MTQALPNPHVAAVRASDDPLTTALERCPIIPSYGPPSVQFIRGEGSHLWDSTGKEYIDLLSGLAVTSLGHSHPAVAAAIADQAQRLLHVSNLFATEHNGHVATVLDQLIAGEASPRGQVFFCNSGAEANEAAIKLARRNGGPGRHVIVSAFQSFHGRTLATLHATGQPAKWEVFQPLPEGFKHVVWNDLDELERTLDETVCGILLEPVQGEGGVNPATREYFEGVRRICDERGIMMMVDEVQTGLARTGEWFGFQHFGVLPDIVSMAKALGNGMPIGAIWAKAEVASAFRPGDHATTYGGQPLATAAAKAVLNVMIDIDAPAKARAVGDKIAELAGALDDVRFVRGLGALVAVELAEGITAQHVAAELLHRGVVVNAVTASALRLAPPLTITDAELEEAFAVIRAVLADGIGRS